MGGAAFPPPCLGWWCLLPTSLGHVMSSHARKITRWQHHPREKAAPPQSQGCRSREKRGEDRGKQHHSNGEEEQYHPTGRGGKHNHPHGGGKGVPPQRENAAATSARSVDFDRHTPAGSIPAVTLRHEDFGIERALPFCHHHVVRAMVVQIQWTSNSNANSNKRDHVVHIVEADQQSLHMPRVLPKLIVQLASR